MNNKELAVENGLDIDLGNKGIFINNEHINKYMFTIIKN